MPDQVNPTQIQESHPQEEYGQEFELLSFQPVYGSITVTEVIDFIPNDPILETQSHLEVYFTGSNDSDYPFQEIDFIIPAQQYLHLRQAVTSSVIATYQDYVFCQIRRYRDQDYISRFGYVAPTSGEAMQLQALMRLREKGVEVNTPIEFEAAFTAEA